MREERAARKSAFSDRHVPSNTHLQLPSDSRISTARLGINGEPQPEAQIAHNIA